MSWVILNHWYLRINPSHWLKLRTNACLALKLANEGYKTVFTYRAMLDGVFGRENTSVFNATRARILA